MAYTSADTNPKVGFRPYGQTNPQGAANLSGLDAQANWKLGQVRAFDPWMLHGYLGQIRPFDQAPGGWLLGQTGFEELQDPQEMMLQNLVAEGVISQIDADGVRNGDVTIEDVTGAPNPLEESSWFGIVELFRNANDELTDLEQKVRDDPAVAVAIGRDVAQAQTRYGDLAHRYIEAYGAVFGSPPSIPGLGSLGLAPVVSAVVWAGVFITVALGLYALIQVNEGLSFRADQATKQAALTLAEKARASGDIETARKELEVADGAKKDKEKPWGIWLQQNWKLLALAGVGIVVAGPMAEGLFGGRRRR